MNLASRRILQAIERSDYPRADAILADCGQLYGTGPSTCTPTRSQQDDHPHPRP